jgi:HK97 family phage major capsid protein
MKLESKQYQALVQKRADLIAEGKALFESAEQNARDLTAEEKARDDAINAELSTLDADLARHEKRRARERNVLVAPAFNRLPRGDNWGGAFAHWVKTGDRGGLDAGDFEPVEGVGMEGYNLAAQPNRPHRKLPLDEALFQRQIQAASNATDMNIGTAADGGDTVPTGFLNEIIARRDETLLAARLPVRLIPGSGTTVDVPVDNEADGEFVVTTEANDFDLDAPALAKKSLTLALYSKYTDVSYQLLDDTAVRILEFLADFVGRGMAKTHNNLLLTEVASGGTSLKTFASATAIAAGEPEGIVSNNDLSAYLDEDAAIAFVTRSASHWAIKAITGNARMYGSNQGADGRELLGYPVLYSQKAAAIAASAKSIYFGNWRYVGYRESPGLTFIRDPYTVALKGQVRLLWHFRTVYKVLQAEAIGFAVHPSA